MKLSKKDEVQMYGVTVSTDEAFEVLMNNDIRMNVFWNTNPAGVYQDPAGYFQMFLYYTPEERAAAYEKISRYFKSAACMVTPVFVERKYLKERCRSE